MPQPLKLAAAAALAGLVAVAAPPAARAAVVFVLDQQYGRILWFDEHGGVHFLAPRPGKTNLLSSPRAIATNDRNELVVLNGGVPELVDIDVRTGEQFEDGGVAAFAFGQAPDGLVFDPRPPPLLSFPSLYVGALGELDVVNRTILTSGASLAAAFPSGWESASSQILATHDPGDGGLDVFASTDAGILGWDGSQTGVFWVPPQGSVTGLDEYGNQLLFAYQYAACPSDYNGIYYIDDSGGVTEHTGFTDVKPFTTGGNVTCPGAIALTKNVEDGIPPTPVYVVDRGSSPQRIYRIDGALQGSRLVATLPADADAVGLVVYTPEPRRAASGAAALAATALLATLRRHPRGAPRARRADPPLRGV